MNIIWKITGGDAYADQKLGKTLVTIHYHAQANNGAPVGDPIAGVCDLSQPDSDSFIAIKDLTQEAMLGWLFSAQPAGWRETVESQLRASAGQPQLFTVPFNV
jgi:hypothetical protein